MSIPNTYTVAPQSVEYESRLLSGYGSINSTKILGNALMLC